MLIGGQLSYLPGIVPILALKGPHPEKTLNPRQKCPECPGQTWNVNNDSAGFISPKQHSEIFFFLMGKEMYSFEIRRAYFLSGKNKSYLPRGPFYFAWCWQAWPWRSCRGRCTLSEKSWFENGTCEGREKTVSNRATRRACEPLSWHLSRKVPHFRSGSGAPKKSQLLHRAVPCLWVTV